MSQAPENALELNIELRWSDQDLMGHVNNARIMTLAEEARIRAMQQLQRTAGSDEPFEAVLRTSNTDFLAPIMYPGDCVVRIWVSKIGNSSFVMQHELSQNGKVAVTVEAVVVMFSSATQAPMQITDNVRKALESVSASSAR
ncbi:MAG: acyl-CoA thioesterase [Yaniella sp.]|uniref:acyl-CoA thioesterase n=1 Tax=Yaniella sp. TaxID=2773929 RepID=UPI00181B7DD2|nr:thioesterase family protein [Yaniella sp.]NLZ99113.1 acyl-CoA thioesterase [Micrococcus sp.]MDN5703771.1 acyl-CoA thioesterase [Yaniella sp.]MDN5731694.1 acyl-CoA thioesterase [Yaniella sp.]MDN5816547.1 acyl-CoA thioesterase [Yaniella sp.]MDN5818096.1 acyl-CoA thioesterase [Yaniella sp.]